MHCTRVRKIKRNAKIFIPSLSFINVLRYGEFIRGISNKDSVESAKKEKNIGFKKWHFIKTYIQKTAWVLNDHTVRTFFVEPLFLIQIFQNPFLMNFYVIISPLIMTLIGGSCRSVTFSLWLFLSSLTLPFSDLRSTRVRRGAARLRRKIRIVERFSLLM